MRQLGGCPPDLNPDLNPAIIKSDQHPPGLVVGMARCAARAALPHPQAAQSPAAIHHMINRNRTRIFNAQLPADPIALPKPSLAGQTSYIIMGDPYATRLTDAAPVTPGLELQRYRGVRGQPILRHPVLFSFGWSTAATPLESRTMAT